MQTKSTVDDVVLPRYAADKGAGSDNVPVDGGCQACDRSKQRGKQHRSNGTPGKASPSLSPAEPKPVLEHLRVVEEKSAVVGGEYRAKICSAVPFCGLVYRVLHTVDLDRDAPLAACRSAAQQALIWPKRPRLSVVVLSDQLRVTTARRSKRTWMT